MTKTNHNKPWSKGDVALLRASAKADTPTKTIARKLKRTIGAIYTKASDENISLKPKDKH